MIIETVLLFGLITMAFEFVLLRLIPPRLRLRMLGSQLACAGLHIGFLLFNLFIHWGTLIGTMSGILAFVASMLTVKLARLMYGHIIRSVYTPGWFKYQPLELR